MMGVGLDGILGFPFLLLPIVPLFVLGIGALIYFATQPRGFRPLFDIEFRDFLTARIIRWLYALGLLVIVLVSAAFILVAPYSIFGVLEKILVFFGAIIFASIVALASAVVWRVWCEWLIVFFRIAEDTTFLAGTKGAARDDTEVRIKPVEEFCPACGAKHLSGNRFCLQCGQALISRRG